MGAGHVSYLPSAGLNRFRFNGSAFASQPIKAPRGVAKDSGSQGRCKGMFGCAAIHARAFRLAVSPARLLALRPNWANCLPNKAVCGLVSKDACT